MLTDTISFIPLNQSHFSILLKWLEAPHVKKWWDQDIIYTPALVAEKFKQYIQSPAISKYSNKNVYIYIILFNNFNIGYIQAYNARDYADENELDLSSITGDICGVDLFIGEVEYLNKGLCQTILYEFDKILAPHFKWCLIDPVKENSIAIRAFEKSGFKEAEQLRTETNIWMIKKLFL